MKQFSCAQQPQVRHSFPAIGLERTRSASSDTIPANVSSNPQELLPALFDTPALGFAIFDDRLRYVAVNQSLATTNGVPASAHLGRTPFQVLGRASEKAEASIAQVLTTGRALQSVEISLKLPNRAAIGHWNLSIFPVRSVSQRVIQVAVTVLEVSVDATSERGNDPEIPLAPREREVLKLVASGKPSKEVADELKLSTRTVETYRSRIMAKLRMHSATSLVLYAVRHNLV